MKKKIVIGLLILLVSLLVLSIRSCHRNSKGNQTSITSTATYQSSRQTSKTSSTSELEVISAQDEATETLERPDEPLEEEETNQVKTSLTTAFAYLTQVTNQSDVRVTYRDKLSVTSLAMAQTVVTMLKAGYQLDNTTLKVYSSDSDNVYQFTVDLIKESSDNLSLAGNYVTGTQQLEIGSLHGIPTGIQ